MKTSKTVLNKYVDVDDLFTRGIMAMDYGHLTDGLQLFTSEDVK